MYARGGLVMKKKKGEKKEKKVALTPHEKMKYEIAEELGLLDQVIAGGWKSLTARETGRIGGLMTKKKREILKKREETQ